jgi:hypothetical protein
MQNQQHRPPTRAGSGAPTTRQRSGLPLCVDCQHFRAGSLGGVDVCTHPNQGFDLVRGEPYARPCAQERQDEREHPQVVCGRGGRGFNPIEQAAA